jgi:predicted O-methyltransferase YrrM
MPISQTIPAIWSGRCTIPAPGTVIIGDNVVRDGEVINGQSDDARVQGVRRFIEMMG